MSITIQICKIQDILNKIYLSQNLFVDTLNYDL